MGAAPGKRGPGGRAGRALLHALTSCLARLSHPIRCAVMQRLQACKVVRGCKGSSTGVPLQEGAATGKRGAGGCGQRVASTPGDRATLLTHQTKRQDVPSAPAQPFRGAQHKLDFWSEQQAGAQAG